MQKTTFEMKYGKLFFRNIFVGPDFLFHRILISSFIFFLILIIALAHFKVENLNEQIKKQYHEFALSLEPVKPKVMLTKQKNILDTSLEPKRKTESVPEDKNQSIITKIPKITIPDIFFDELSHEADLDEERVSPRSSVKVERGQIKLELDALLDDPLTYKIERDAELFIEEPVGNSEEEVKFGYRDQEEIYRIIDSKQVNIEACYEKAAKHGMVNSGYLIVEFQITSDGFILPQTIRIIKSTLFNKKVEQCIKKNIRRLRGFEKLDKSKGTAKVTHKFVFN
jgi:hypothetical protein